MFLAGDIGGTKTLLALVEPEKSGAPGHRILTERFQRRFSSADYPSLDSIIAEFLASIPGQRPGIQAACFGVAGAIHEGRCRATNLPWSMDERELAKALGCDPARVKLLNDVEATAYGLLFLKPDEWVELNPGAVDSERATSPWWRRAPGWANPSFTGTAKATIPWPARAATAVSRHSRSWKWNFGDICAASFQAM